MPTTDDIYRYGQLLIAEVQKAASHLHEARRYAEKMGSFGANEAKEIARRLSVEIRMFEVYIDQVRRRWMQ